MKKYLSIPAEIEAHQFDNIILPDFMSFDMGGAYIKNIKGAIVYVWPGEWVIREPESPDRYYTMPDAIFKKKYILKEDHTINELSNFSESRDQ